MDIGAAVADMWRTVIVFIPKAVAFVAILVIGWLVARFLRKWVDRLLERVGFDRAVQRGGLRRWLAGGKYDASGIVATLVYYAVLLFTLQLAFGLWGPNPVSDLIQGVIAWLPKALVAIVIIVVAAALASAVKDVVSSALAGLSYGRLLASLASFFIIGLGIIAALNQVGIATTVTMPVLIAVLATVAGILIVGVGGGMIRPMQQRWERWLGRAEQESENLKEHIQAHAAGRRDAIAAAEAQAQAEAARVRAESASADETQLVPVAAVTGTARPVNSSVQTQKLPRITDQSAPSQPAQAVQASPPVRPAQPPQPAQPPKAAQPPQAAQPVQASQPVRPAQPPQATEPTQATQPAPSERPTERTRAPKQVEPADPGNDQ
ncbi:hypothetical protein Rhe02_36950 [Rhizocola hellebori]|uniref:Uncharacterized protein n=1 Tax=Rhizocola hellebori TaxID=1392758 RepID=A0A8J3Q7N2_9ACTN|nr:hypothetical protein Rhe02_36950 [Rhizocola hellebori]